MKLTKNFESTEFNCHDGTPVPEDLMGNITELARNLQVLRDTIGEPMQILSGYRTKTWNKKVGGVGNSMHLIGKASDLTTKSLSPRELHLIILTLIKEKQIHDGGLGLYPGFVHYDIGKSRRW